MVGKTIQSSLLLKLISMVSDSSYVSCLYFKSWQSILYDFANVQVLLILKD